MDKSEARERLERIESEAKALLAIIEEPEWRPKKPTLCWIWDFFGTRTQADVVSRYKDGYITQHGSRWKHAQPLTRGEALAMVDSPRYDWSKAPEWANWAATDRDGQASWYANRPEMGSNKTVWVSATWEPDHAWYTGDDCTDWLDSLEARPE